MLPSASPTIPEEKEEQDEEEEQDERYDTMPEDGLLERQTTGSGQVLPWGAPKERARFPSTFNIETDIRPGEFVMRTLFAGT